jgi:hypothetical protein
MSENHPLNVRLSKGKKEKEKAATKKLKKLR